MNNGKLLATASACALLVLAVNAPASAGDRVVSMSGEVRTFNVAPPTAPPNNILFNAVNSVSLSGMDPQVQITVPASAFTATQTRFRIFPTVPSLAQLASSFSGFAPQERAFTGNPGNPAVLRGGGGPAANGTVGLCPPLGNPANPNCLIPQSATGGLTGVIRVFPIAGKSQFGGTFKVLQKKAGSLSRFTATVVTTTPNGETNTLKQHRHTPFTVSNIWAGGAGFGGGTVSSPYTGPHQGGGPAKVTLGAVVHPTLFYIVSPGQFVTSIAPPPAQTPWGVALTTGRITIRDEKPVVATQTTTGFDTRPSQSDTGVIQLVGGSVMNQPFSGNAFQDMVRVTMTLPEPGPTTGLLAGFAALFAVAWLRARR